MSGGRDRLVAALDIGSSKTACFIARLSGAGDLDLLGMGHQASRGVSGGCITDMDAAEQSIRSAVDRAEKVAGETVDRVIVSVSAGQPRSQILEMEVDIGGEAVEAADIDRVIAEVAEEAGQTDREILHAFPACYGLDGAFSSKPPVGMYGDRLSVALHLITVQPGPLRNLETCVRRAHLDVDRFVLAPFAAAHACLVEDEMTLGAACLDMGGGTTSLAVYAQKALVFADVIPFGGVTLTQDIARGLLTPVDHAERLKTLFGEAIQSTGDDLETIDVPQIGESDTDENGLSRLPRSMMTGLIQPRLEGLFEEARDRLHASGFDSVSGKRVVLTGGAAALPGTATLAQRVMGKNIRVARPRPLPGMALATSGPEFAVCTGLLLNEAEGPREILGRPADPRPLVQANSGFARVGRWLKENF